MDSLQGLAELTAFIENEYDPELRSAAFQRLVTKYPSAPLRLVLLSHYPAVQREAYQLLEKNANNCRLVAFCSDNKEILQDVWQQPAFKGDRSAQYLRAAAQPAGARTSPPPLDIKALSLVELHQLLVFTTDVPLRHQILVRIESLDPMAILRLISSGLGSGIGEQAELILQPSIGSPAERYMIDHWAEWMRTAAKPGDLDRVAREHPSEDIRRRAIDRLCTVSRAKGLRLLAEFPSKDLLKGMTFSADDLEIFMRHCEDEPSLVWAAHKLAARSPEAAMQLMKNHAIPAVRAEAYLAWSDPQEKIGERSPWKEIPDEQKQVLESLDEETLSALATSTSRWDGVWAAWLIKSPGALESVASSPKNSPAAAIAAVKRAMLAPELSRHIKETDMGMFPTSQGYGTPAYYNRIQNQGSPASLLDRGDLVHGADIRVKLKLANGAEFNFEWVTDFPVQVYGAGGFMPPKTDVGAMLDKLLSAIKPTQEDLAALAKAESPELRAAASRFK